MSPVKTPTEVNGDFPKLSFVIIVLNGMPFLQYAIRAVYAIAHEIIIVEGAIEECLFAANSSGSSTDDTVEFIRKFPDKKQKIHFIGGRWLEKVDMQNKALEIVSGDYVWLVDSDEIYKQEDLIRIRELIKEDPSITQINFIPDNFWKGFDYTFAAPKFFDPQHHYRRVFKFTHGALFTSHRPPTMVHSGSSTTTEQIHLISGFQTRDMGIYPYHYSYVLNDQVSQKVQLYKRYGWGEIFGINLDDWYEHFFLEWSSENREILEKRYPVWIGDRNSYTTRFKGVHPEIIADFIVDFERKNPRGDFDSRYVNSVLGTKKELTMQFAKWAEHPELKAVEGGWIYKEAFYPDYLTVGGASSSVFSLALNYCKGIGIDHGAGCWPLPGSIPIDIQGLGAKNRVEGIQKGSLDYVFSSHFLEHTEDWLDYLFLWNSFLKPSGKMFLYLPHPDCKIWHRGTPMIGEGHRWVPEPGIVVDAVREVGFKILKSSREPDAMQSFYVLAEKKNEMSQKDQLETKLKILENIKPKQTGRVFLSNLKETFSGAFVGFMGILNAFAGEYGLRQFTNWSKIWEYPWLWFNGLSQMNWKGSSLLDIGSELSPMPWFLASLGANVTLTETDQQWVPKWERICEETGLELKWQIVSEERLPFADKSFDLVTSFSVIEHQRDKKTVVNEVVRVLNPGGLLAISFDICEPEMGMTFPEWNGKAMTMAQFEELVWNHSALDNKGHRPRWNVEDIPQFIKWHLQSAPHHNYAVGAAVLRKRLS